MASRTQAHASTATAVERWDEVVEVEEVDEVDEIDEIDEADGTHGAAAGVTAPRRTKRRAKRLVLAAASAIVAAWLAVAMLGESGGEGSGAPAGGVVPADVDLDAPPLPRADVPAGCQVADAAVVTALVASTDIVGGGGVDNPFVADVSDAGDVERLVSARILGGDSRGELGLWGISHDGDIVPLDERAIAVSRTGEGPPSSDLTAAVQSDAADMVAKCTKAAAGG